MNLKSFLEGICLDAGAQQLILDYPMDNEAYASYKQLFYQDRNSFFAIAKKQANRRQLFLYLYVRLAVDAYEEYRRRGIDESVYFDTFSDIRIWCSSCLRDCGEYGIAEYEWLQEHVLLRIFRLGRLQFQPGKPEHDISIPGRTVSKDQTVLHVHIPEGERLDPGAVEKSFERAQAFFTDIEPIFVCQTWLLYPALNEILDPDSNILRFQRQFYIYEVDHLSRQAEERIFRQIDSDPGEYETVTRLQQKAKAWLMSGKKLGIGCGIKFGGQTNEAG